MDGYKIQILEFIHNNEPKVSRFKLPAAGKFCNFGKNFQDVGIGFLLYSRHYGSEIALVYLIQYYTHLLNRSYAITLPDVKDIQQNNLTELIERICNSVGFP